MHLQSVMHNLFLWFYRRLWDIISAMGNLWHLMGRKDGYHICNGAWKSVIHRKTDRNIYQFAPYLIWLSYLLVDINYCNNFMMIIVDTLFWIAHLNPWRTERRNILDMCVTVLIWFDSDWIVLILPIISYGDDNGGLLKISGMAWSCINTGTSR